MTISCQKMPENAKIFYCEKCDFKCFKQSNYDKHLSTRKHKMITNDDQNDDTNRAKLYICICGKNTNLDMDYMFIAKNRVQDRRQKNNPKSGKNVVLNEWNG